MDIKRIDRFIKRHYQNDLLIPFYRRVIQPILIKKIRNKDVINVMFVVTELGPWKTEQLYLTLRRHKRFNPIIGVSFSLENPMFKSDVIKYMQAKEYVYVDLDKNGGIEGQDIIFYQKPYDGCYMPNVLYLNNLNALFCYVLYGFHSTDTSWAPTLPFYKCVWQNYYESDPPYRTMSRNDVITGLPFQDLLINSKDDSSDPWKVQDCMKKRIIFAPHHTIGNMHLDGLAVGSFLENAEIMLELLHKYKDKVQWAFKPHPLLYTKLIDEWGKEKTDEYYDEWKNSPNSQYENGAYDSLFMHSDAMIHDCVSFNIEYHYTHNPVFFLIRQERLEASRTPIAQRAYDLHYKGHTKEQIDMFIKNVIDGIDPLYDERMEYYNEYLLPPHGKSACDNIINAILGNNVS